MKILISNDPLALTEKLRLLADTIPESHLVVSACALGPTPKASVISMPDELDLTDQKELAATIADAMGQSLLNRGFLADAKTLIQQAFDLRSEFLGQDHPATAASLNSLARVARNEGRLEAAEQHGRAAVAINTRIFGDSSYPVALSLNELARIQLQKSDLPATEESATHGLKILESLHLETKDLTLSRLLDTLARVHQCRGEYGKAAELYSRALALDLKQLGPTHPEYVTHFGNLATVLEAQGDLEGARQGYQKVIDTYTSAQLGLPDHPNRIDAESNLAAVLLALQDYGQAGVHVNLALEIGRRVRGEVHYLVGKDYLLKGRYEFERPDSNAAAALEDINKALKIYESNRESSPTATATGLPALHGYIAEALTWKGRVLLEQGSGSDEAELDLRRAVSTWNADLGEDSVEGAIAGAYLGRVLYLRDKTNPEAHRLLERGYCIASAARGADSRTARLLKPWLDQAASTSEPDPCKK